MLCFALLCSALLSWLCLKTQIKQKINQKSAQQSTKNRPKIGKKSFKPLTHQPIFPQSLGGGVYPSPYPALENPPLIGVYLYDQCIKVQQQLQAQKVTRNKKNLKR